MRATNAISFIIVLSSLFSCGSASTKSESSLIDTTSNSTEDRVENSDNPQKILKAVALWKTGIKDKPGTKDAKWLTGIKFGEQVEVLQDSLVKEGEREKRYIQIRLSDNQVGWDNAYLYAEDAVQGVVTTDAQLYDRPDILAMANESLTKGELVAVFSNGQDSWKNVAGYNKKKTGWVNAKGGVSTRAIDLKVAVMMNMLKEIAPESPEYDVMLSQILDDPNNEASVFYEDLYNEHRAKTPATPDSVLLEDQQEELDYM